MADYKLRIIVEGVDKASGVLKGVGGALGNIGQIAAGVGIGNLLSGAVTGLAGAARGALDAYAAYERLGTSINSLAAKEALLTGQASSMQEALGQTAGKSQELLGWIQKLAIESPFKQEDVASAFRLSMALGFNTAEAQRLTQAMLNFSTATGAGGESMERISRALGQIRTKGRLSMEEVNQLTESGVDVMRILADATGKTGQALVKDISSGAVSAQAAVEAIIADTERLYSGAGAAAATSMSGLLSTLEEIGGLSGRNLLSGIFSEAQPYLASIVSIVTAPEFQAGLTAWGEKLGGFTADGLQGAADAMERIDAAVAPLLDKGAPPWLVALQGAAAAGDYAFDVKITPEVTTLKTPDGGLQIDVTPTATSVTNKDGGLFKIDAEAQVVSFRTDSESPTINFTAAWEKGIIGSLIAAAQAESDQEANKVLLTAGWHDTPAVIAQTLVDGIRQYGAQNPTSMGADLGQWIKDGLKPAFEGYSELVTLDAQWKAGMAVELFDAIQSNFGEPIMLVGSWVYDTMTNLWSGIQSFFASNPVSIVAEMVAGASTTEYGTEHSGHANHPRKPSPVYPTTSGDYMSQPASTNWWDFGNNAAGTDSWRGGWTWVGEKGPELLNLPKGSQILSNGDSKRMIGNLAEGTTGLPDWLTRGLGAMGLWVPQASAGAQMGPRTRDDAYGGWQDFTRKGTQAMQETANQTGNAFAEAAEQTNDAFKSALQGVDGLFGTSQVTADQMRMAEMGVPQNFADDYLRQLSDEVLNGVDWANVDVKDAAQRAGIDPNLPANVILELVKNAWNDSSLFANAANLDLINQDAVKAAIEQQQKELAGKANIMQMFGITDENMQDQIDGLGAGLASVFGQAAETDAMKTAGVQAFAAIGQGFGDANTAATAVGGMAQAVVTATGLPENQAALEDAGKAGAHAYYGGWKSYMGDAPTVPPAGNATGPAAPTVPPAGNNALGTSNWRGGWTWVGEYGPELMSLPGGTRIQDAAESRRMGRSAQKSVVVNQTFVVNDKLMAEQAAQRAVQLIRRGA